MQKKSILLILLAVVLYSPAVPAQDKESAAKPQGDTCRVEDRACVLQYLRSIAGDIDQKMWHDQTLRELAKTYAADGQIDAAISIIPDIHSNDTKAMTIRGIGMAVADLGWSEEKNAKVFTKLRTAAERIDHPPSYAIALTYIAMGQAFAGNNEGAWATAADMENDALRHKAYAETAEIQAEQGDFEAAMKSIAYIDSEAFRNKAYAIISKIFADADLLDEAYKATMENTNAYKKAQGLQYILDVQKQQKEEKDAQ